MKKTLVLLCFLSQLTNAQNLIANGGFDTNTDNWEALDGGSVVISWVASDGNVANGSIELNDDFNNGGVGNIHSEKVPVIENTNYKISAFAKPISNSEAEGAAIFIAWYNDDFQIGSSDFVYVSTAQANDNWFLLEEIFTSPTGAKFADVRLGVDSPSSDSTDNSTARFDDVRLELSTDDPNAFAMVTGHSALWYNPNQSGHGINLYMLPNQGVLVFWYVYDNSGNPIWLLGIGTHDGFKATMNVSISNGAMFPPNFDPDDVNLVNWGQFELSFSGCDAGLFKWIPLVGNGFTAGEMNIIRVNKTLGLSCQE